MPPVPAPPVDKRLRRLEALLRRLNAARDLAHLLSMLELELPLLLEFAHFSLHRFEAGRLRLTVSTRLDPASTPPVDVTREASPLWDAAQQGRALVVATVSGRPSALAVPLFAEDSLVGVLLLEQPGPGADLEVDEQTLKFYEAVGSHIGNAFRLRERTAALEAALGDLRRAQGELIRTERTAAVGKLASGIAHELKNPLMSMTFAVENIRDLVADTKPPAALVSALDMLGDDIRRMRDRVQTFLALARTGQAQSERNPPQRCTAAALLRKVAERFRHDARAARIAIRDHAGDDGTVLVDEDQLFAALSNLLVNALEALAGRPDGAPSGTIDLWVRTLEARVQLIVADNGPGVPPELRERIFDIFFTTKPAGTGLGLSQVFVFAEQHGGRVWIDPSAQGARFVLDLPEASR